MAPRAVAIVANTDHALVRSRRRQRRAPVRDLQARRALLLRQGDGAIVTWCSCLRRDPARCLALRFAFTPAELAQLEDEDGGCSCERGCHPPHDATTARRAA